ncbi:MAG: DUF1343 domain-containing protein [Bacteroidia bacterium]|nr:DUF1343 domain-containing protein [Bacteroidia bacterium]
MTTRRRPTHGCPLRTVLTVAVLLPIFAGSAAAQQAPSRGGDPAVVCGADVLIRDSLHLCRGKRVGVITNHTGVLGDGTLLIDRLRREEGVTLAAIFSPEHGPNGSAPDGAFIADGKDGDVKVYSLYGTVRKPTAGMLEGLDVLLYDLQDAGSRYYTYISTLALCLEAAAGAGIPLVVLDRPNPLGGEMIEGPLRREGMQSFVGMLPVPVRHGMTAGELASMMIAEGWIRASGVKLHVIPMRGWSRSMYYEETGLRWLPPSPNLRTVEAALAYAGTCLLEGSAISEGRGTDAPFLQFGAPFIDGEEVAEALTVLGLPGVRFHAVTFTPKADHGSARPKFAGVPCFGIRLHVTDRKLFRPFETGRKILSVLHHLYGERMVFTSYLDSLAGVADFADRCVRIPPVSNECDWTEEIRDFFHRRTGYLLYH